MVTSAATTPVKASKSAKANDDGQETSPTKPSYAKSILAVLQASKERKGISAAAIRNYLTEQGLGHGNKKIFNNHFRDVLTAQIAKGLVKRTGGEGFESKCRFKLVPVKTPAKEKTPAEKRAEKTPAKKTPAKKPAEKKASSKKSAEKKASAKKPAAKKPAAKMPAAKKPAVKSTEKAAPKSAPTKKAKENQPKNVNQTPKKSNAMRKAKA